ncbi:hypothetical protein N431DRAFT_325815 [Stipitochalara longipes BDJ]|nr:hypothetical protein N431DRAFT_325815 [Stipitochalara longipes BDJ]
MALDALTTQAFVQARQTSTADLPHDNYGPRLNVAIWFLTGLAAVFLGLRLYCKRIRQNKLWWDDYILIAAFVALLTQTSLLSVCIHRGLGRHSWDITDWPDYLYVANITGVCSILAAAWSKTSFAVTLLRLSTGWMRRLIWFIIASVNIFLGLSCIFTYVQCKPVKRLWDTSVPGACWNQEVIIRYNSFSSAWSGGMDILLATLPWRLINKLTLNKKERIGVIVGMSIGSLAGVTSIAKTATLSAIKNPDAIATVSLMILATAETAITIVAASIPVLRVFIRNTMKSQSSRDDSQKTQFSTVRNVSGFELLTPPSPVRIASSKKSEIGTWLDEQSSISKEARSKSTEDSWLSSASQSRLEVHGPEA